jgi:wyosine [tRNA(Phe)-imidazoG37] synthetase (radical SAM superfamily)
MNQIVPGPVCSPGLGACLAVSFTPPDARVCTFDCRYCSVPPRPRRGAAVRWPSPGDIASAVANALPGAAAYDSLVVGGCGEPTLHPHFTAALLGVLGVVRSDRPDMAVRVRTAGAQIHRGEVRRGLDLADERILKLDPAPERTQRPSASNPLGAILAGATALRDLSIQAVLIDGPEGNCDAASLESWIGLIEELRPQRVYLTTPDGPRAEGRVLPVPRERLEKLAAQLTERAGIPASLP